MIAITPNIETRFWSKVDTNGPVHPTLNSRCWIWTAHKNNGYGGFGVGSRTDGSRRTAIASRVAWELLVGAIPDDMWVLHHCDNPPCVNPAHLFLGDNDANVRDRQAKGRDRNPVADACRAQTHCKRGHAFTPANTYRPRNGKRHCRLCRQAAQRQYHQIRRAA